MGTVANLIPPVTRVREVPVENFDDVFKRWVSYVYYHGKVDPIMHYYDEISDLEPLIEVGPDFTTIACIRTYYNLGGFHGKAS